MNACTCCCLTADMACSMLHENGLKYMNIHAVGCLIVALQAVGVHRPLSWDHPARISLGEAVAAAHVPPPALTLKSLHSSKKHGLQYSDLHGIPCLLILCEKGRMGDTFPHTFCCLDLRIRTAAHASSFVQELGRLCRYPSAPGPAPNQTKPSAQVELLADSATLSKLSIEARLPDGTEKYGIHETAAGMMYRALSFCNLRETTAPFPGCA